MSQARNHRDWAIVGVVVAALITVNALAHFAGHWPGLLAVPVGAVAVVLLARMRGLAWSEMGISSSELKYGFRWSAIVVVAVVVVVGAGVAIPWTRTFFLNDRYSSARDALLAALVWIPVQTVLPEELLFRGVLQGSLRRVMSRWLTLIAGAALFGLWHIASSLGLSAGNAGVTDAIGAGVGAAVAGVVGAVVATSAAGWILGWLRFRTANLLAPIVLHWTLNASGALGAALAWQLL
ncbi:CPBP family intramembrane glutamic endopeptidase [Gordonia sihwensis]|uniref:CPBP family intramembrane glutamic endopeptidase n=1 Tax=Gordonia sihwensis TaxID=173559 RepID=UPI0005EE37A1|nr:CPBP family intramembrane glutamic endopeptidase [Gordonia sihwensis]KJR07640.1 abortive infection protein [Gordonia sihwensis]